IQKLFLEENNLIDVNLSHSNGGFVDVEEGLDYVYTIYLTDYAGNQSVLKVPIKGAVSNPDELQTRKVLETDYLAFWNRPNVFDLTYHDIFIPKNALYENTYLELESV